MTKDTGGPAFPSKKRIQRMGYTTQEFEPVDGMTLRDYFAAKAMQGFIASSPATPEYILRHMTSDAYAMADAMLKARGTP
jgi:hypothetical protein